MTNATRVLAVCHFGLIAVTLLHVLSADLALPAASVIAILLVGPLLASLPGILANRRYTLQWLTIYLVVLIGVTVTETVATRGAWLAECHLGVACLELVLILRFLRRAAAPKPPGSTGP